MEDRRAGRFVGSGVVWLMVLRCARLLLTWGRCGGVIDGRLWPGSLGTRHSQLLTRAFH